MNADLRTVLTERIDAIEPPAGSLERARHQGRRIRRRRRTLVATGSLAVAAVVGGTAALAVVDEDGSRTVEDESRYASVGRLDFSMGARAYADPGNKVHLGGREIDYGRLDYLDTDAVATQHGIVFFDKGRPMLLGPSGGVQQLVDGPLDHSEEFRPTAKADSQAPLVAWATLPEGRPTITVRNMETGEDVATAELDCGRCSDVVIDAIDGGVVFVRDRAGTRTWDTGTGEWRDFAGADTRVADVRNGVVLHDGPAPTDPGEWRPVAGAIDAQLTYDGGHILYWSSTLEPTTPGGEPIVLAQGPAEEGEGFGWYAVDTDGSVLVATGKDYGDFTVYDCALPSGGCDRLGPLRPTSGDPEFIGVDM